MGTGVMGTVRKNVKTPLKALNEEVLVTTFTLLRTVPVPPFPWLNRPFAIFFDLWYPQKLIDCMESGG
jgi:hypothetical protein